MTSFNERERGFEAKFALDQDVQFRLVARRDKLFAAWAAAELSLSPDDAAALMQAAVHVADGAGHDDRLLDLMMPRFPERPDFPLRMWLGANLATCAVEANGELIAALAEASAAPPGREGRPVSSLLQVPEHR